MSTDLTYTNGRWAAPAADRELLAAVSRWAHTKPAGKYWPRYEQSFWPGWYVSRDRTVEVCWRPNKTYDGDFTVTVREAPYEPAVQVTLPAEVVTVRRAVDLLVLLGVLPVEFSSAYTAAREVFEPAGGAS